MICPMHKAIKGEKKIRAADDDDAYQKFLLSIPGLAFFFFSFFCFSFGVSIPFSSEALLI